MIVFCFGTKKEVRIKARSEFLGKNVFDSVVTSQNFQELESLVYAQDLFSAEPKFVEVISLSIKKEIEEVLSGLLPEMKESNNHFFLDEPFASTFFIKKIEKLEFSYIDAREKKEEKAFPRKLANAIERRDKKEAWIEWLDIKKEGELDMLLGMMWWQIKKIWTDILSGKKTAYKEEEISALGLELISLSNDAHVGKRDLEKGIEKFLLSL